MRGVMSSARGHNFMTIIILIMILIIMGSENNDDKIS